MKMKKKRCYLFSILTRRLSCAINVKQTSDLSIGYNLNGTCAGACDRLSRRKCTC